MERIGDLFGEICPNAMSLPLFASDKEICKLTFCSSQWFYSEGGLRMKFFLVCLVGHKPSNLVKCDRLKIVQNI
jgi:hypothetical protein